MIPVPARRAQGLALDGSRALGRRVSISTQCYRAVLTKDIIKINARRIRIDLNRHCLAGPHLYLRATKQGTLRPAMQKTKNNQPKIKIKIR